jgi:hypothetical protein
MNNEVLKFLNAEVGAQNMGLNHVNEFFKVMDTNKDGALTWKEYAASTFKDVKVHSNHVQVC